MVYAIALGENVMDARANILKAEGLWAGTLAVRTEVPASISIWPNPTSGMLHIDVTERASTIVRDMLGRELLRSTSSDIDLSSLPAGVYELEVNISGETLHRRVVRE
jgi:hypothetical protein